MAPYMVGTATGGSVTGTTTVSSTTVAKVLESQAYDLESRASQFRAITPSGFLPPHSTTGTGGWGSVGTVLETSTALTTSASGKSGYDFVSIATSAVQASESNIIGLGGFAPSVCVNGYNIKLESRPSKFAPMIFELPDAPTTGSRQDLVIMECWKEEVTPGANDDCFFPFGNVGYDPYNNESSYDGCTLLNADATGGNWPAYMNNGHGNPSSDSSLHGDYVRADDANIETFINNPDNNVGLTEDGKYYQVRYRIATLENSTPEFGENWLTAILGIRDLSEAVFPPQGKLASRPSNGVDSSSNGTLIYQNGKANYASVLLDSGMFIGGQYVGGSDPISAISDLSLDGFTYNIPIAIVHRRNSTAYSDANQNGGVAISVGTSDRPDSLYYDQIAKDDILDLRHRVSPNGFDVPALQEETMQQLLKSDLATNWEESYAVSGADQNNDSDFDSTSTWNLGTGYSQTGDGYLNYSDDGNGQSFATQTLASPAGTTFLITVKIDELSRGSGGFIRFRTGSDGIAGAIYGTGIYTFVQTSAGGTNFFYIEAYNLNSAKLDYVKCVPVCSVYSTKPVVREGIIGNGSVAGNTSTFITNDDNDGGVICNNGISASPDGLRSYYSDQAGEQSITGYIANESASELGSTLIANGDFAADSDWTKVSTTISGGTANFTGTDASKLEQAGIVEEGKYYSITYTISAYTSGIFRAYVGGTFVSNRSSNGTFTDIIKAGGTGVFTLYGLSGSPTMSVDNVSVKELTPSGLVQYDSDNNKIYCNAALLESNDLSEADRPQFSGRKPVVTWADSDASVNVSWDTMVGDTLVGTIASADSGDDEGYTAHSGAGIWVNNSVEFKAGSGFLSRVPYSDNNSIIQSQYFVDGTQVLPNDGIGWKPFGSPVDFENEKGDRLDSHTKSTSLSGFKGGITDLETGRINSCVIKDGSTYKSWYTYNNDIWYSTSTDGVSWTGAQEVVSVGDEGTYDTSNLDGPTVIKDGPTDYKMWYSGKDGTYWRVLYATSTDGISWTGNTMVVDRGAGGESDADYIYSPTVINDGGTYKMWYGGTSVNWQIHYATSTNGSTWTKYNGGDTPVIGIGESGSSSVNGSYNPCVIKDGSVYKIWYNGYDSSNNNRIHYSSSVDGINWNKSSLYLPLGLDGESDDIGTSSPTVIKDDATYKMWYSGADGTNNIIHHVVLTMSDSDHTGSEGSLTGVYSTGGPLNHAPIANSSVVLTYQHRALQQDWSRLGGTDPNHTLDYTLRNIADKAIVTTLGTGANPEEANHYSAYRDFTSSLVQSGTQALYEYNSSNLDLSGPSRTDRVQYLTFGKVDYTFISNPTWTTESIPSVSDYISLSSLDMRENYLYDGNYPTFGNYSSIELNTSPSADDSGVNAFVPAVGEKNKELFVAMSTSYDSIDTDNSVNCTQLFNLIGRPVVK